MKNIITTGLAFAVVAVVSNALAADAHRTDCAGPNFGMYYGSDSTCAVRGVDGFYQSCSGSRYVSGASVRAVSTAGENILIDLYNGTGTAATVSCTFWSIDYDGNPNTGVSGSASNFTGYRTISLSLSTANAPTSTYTSVYCYLPTSVKILGATKY